MAERPATERPRRAEPGGLCPICRHKKEVTSERGSKFLLCRLAAKNPGYPKYPPQPVVSCPGFER